MHKSLDFLRKEKENNNKKNILFLDIDGVLQPYSSQKRFEHNLEETIEYVCDKYNDDIYKEISKYDVGAVFYDWDEIAIGILKKILLETNSYIVIHSNWRESKDIKKMKALFKIHDLDEYVVDSCEHNGNGEKIYFIKKYIEEHKQEINNYIIIDDDDMTLDLGGNFYQTNNILTLSDYYNICWLLNKKNTYTYTIKKENDLKYIFEFYHNNKKEIIVKCDVVKLIHKGCVMCYFDCLLSENEQYIKNISTLYFYINNILLNFFYENEKDCVFFIISANRDKKYQKIAERTKRIEELSQKEILYNFSLVKK